ncbi:MAG: hypothetical protein LH618_08955 [Saprospiraceae bacterium]|nr:hypothetical protein [Saprospiraceae bacterium]
MSDLLSEKYPRTYHFPFSAGTTHDDRIQADWQGILPPELLWRNWPMPAPKNSVVANSFLSGTAPT